MNAFLLPQVTLIGGSGFFRREREPIHLDQNLWPLAVLCPKEKYSSNQGVRDKAHESKRKIIKLV
jgi:hypothetical protein